MQYLHLLLINPPDIGVRPPAGNTGTLFLSNNQVVRCINPGILSIASYIEARKKQVEIIDLLEDGNLSTLERQLINKSPWVIGISCSNGFSYLPTLECAQLARKLCPGSLIVIGGQHVGPLGKVVLLDSPDIDVVVKYEGEVPVDELIDHFGKYGRKLPPLEIAGIVYRDAQGIIQENTKPSELVDLDNMPYLNFELYPNFRRFAPYIEESRGCSFGCNFCLSNHTNRSSIRVKSPKRFLDEIKHTISIYGKDPIYPVLASTFGVRYGNTKRIIDGMRNMGIRWTTELRVDGTWLKLLEDMHAAGFRIATLGLESASPTILFRMNKTRNPTVYLERAQKMIHASSAYNDLMLKVNIILYIGETPETIRETLGFILRNSDAFAAVRFSPLFGFPGSPFLAHMKSFEKSFGSSLVTNDFWVKTHIFPVNISKYFDFQEASFLSNILERIFSREEKYFLANQYTYGLTDLENLKDTVTEGRIFKRIEF